MRLSADKKETCLFFNYFTTYHNFNEIGGRHLNIYSLLVMKIIFRRIRKCCFGISHKTSIPQQLWKYLEILDLFSNEVNKILFFCFWILVFVKIPQPHESRNVPGIADKKFFRFFIHSFRVICFINTSGRFLSISMLNKVLFEIPMLFIGVLFSPVLPPARLEEYSNGFLNLAECNINQGKLSKMYI